MTAARREKQTLASATINVASALLLLSLSFFISLSFFTDADAVFLSLSLPTFSPHHHHHHYLLADRFSDVCTIRCCCRFCLSSFLIITHFYFFSPSLFFFSDALKTASIHPLQYTAASTSLSTTSACTADVDGALRRRRGADGAEDGH